MAKKLAEMQEREKYKREEREKRDAARSGAEKKVAVWTQNRNLRLPELLASIETVLYTEHTWKPVSMEILKTPANVKINYCKAILLVHPDKVGSKNLSSDQQMLAELIFHELQIGYETFVARK